MTPGYSELVVSYHDGIITLKECGASIDLYLTQEMSKYLLDRVVDVLGVEEASRILAKRSNHGH